MCTLILQLCHKRSGEQPDIFQAPGLPIQVSPEKPPLHSHVVLALTKVVHDGRKVHGVHVLASRVQAFVMTILGVIRHYPFKLIWLCGISEAIFLMCVCLCLLGCFLALPLEVCVLSFAALHMMAATPNLKSKTWFLHSNI